MAAGLDVERIYREHGHVVLRRAMRILGHETEARDVLQDVFTSLVARPEQYRGDSAITTFLYAMTTNACFARLRNRRKRTELLDRNPADTSETAPSPDGAASAAQILARLPERLAIVAIYYFIDEMTHDEIAQILGVSRRHVGNLVAQVLDEAHRQEAA